MEQSTAIGSLQVDGDVIAKPKQRRYDHGRYPIPLLPKVFPAELVHSLPHSGFCLGFTGPHQGCAQLGERMIGLGLRDVGRQVDPQPL